MDDRHAIFNDTIVNIVSVKHHDISPCSFLPSQGLALLLSILALFYFSVAQTSPHMSWEAQVILLSLKDYI